MNKDKLLLTHEFESSSALISFVNNWNVCQEDVAAITMSITGRYTLFYWL